MKREARTRDSERVRERRREIGEMFEELEYSSAPEHGELEFVLDVSPAAPEQDATDEWLKREGKRVERKARERAARLAIKLRGSAA